MPDTSGIAQGQLTLDALGNFGGDPRNIFVEQIIWDNPSRVRLIFAVDGEDVTNFPLRFMVTVIR